jgi:hypothetical protein
LTLLELIHKICRTQARTLVDTDFFLMPRRLAPHLLFALAYAFVLLILALGRGPWAPPGESQRYAADHGLSAARAHGVGPFAS